MALRRRKEPAYRLSWMKTEEKQRMNLVQNLEGIISYEKKRQEKARRLARQQEEDKAAEAVLEYSNKGGILKNRLYC